MHRRYDSPCDLPLTMGAIANLKCEVLQGDDVVHDAIRQQQVEAGVPALIAAALAQYQGQHEEVLWAALFSLAVLIREGSNPYILSTEAAVQAGLLPLLQSAVKDYEVTSTCWLLPKHDMAIFQLQFVLLCPVVLCCQLWQLCIVMSLTWLVRACLLSCCFTQSPKGGIMLVARLLCLLADCHRDSVACSQGHTTLIDL